MIKQFQKRGTLVKLSRMSLYKLNFRMIIEKSIKSSALKTNHLLSELD